MTLCAKFIIAPFAAAVLMAVLVIFAAMLSSMISEQERKQ